LSAACTAQLLVENPPRVRHIGRVNCKILFPMLLGRGCFRRLHQAGRVRATLNPPPSVDDLLPKHAQPKLPTMKIYLGAEVLDAELALTDDQEFTAA
jgi:hypothetical protein